MNNIKIRERLNTSITSGNKVIILDYDSLDIIHLLCKVLVSKNISNVEIWQSIEEKPNSELSKFISREIVNKAIYIYRMYDFSDKVFVISDSDQYGTMFNYVKTGILTKQEMIDALLYKI
ncbi:hypothetical protein [Oribacterium sp. NK2B42]|uniref:hypothetical protein n=1 Tax=Oribacterium sp. NK2B42 TaxID=689781 RepID=UPI000492B830|nr:hypothetical protein [Oribacterium sp. NK2B42]